MTDNEIVKALECCGRNSIAGWLNECKNCPLHDRTTCIPELMYNAKDLINRQKEEIERLEKNLETETNHITRLENQIERLLQRLKTAKAEAYKEFAERLECAVMRMGKTPEGDIALYDFTVLLADLLKELEGEQI